MPRITFPDVSLGGIHLDQYKDLKGLRDAYFHAVPEVCIERPRLITEFHVRNGLLDRERISILDKAKRVQILSGESDRSCPASPGARQGDEQFSAHRQFAFRWFHYR